MYYNPLPVIKQEKNAYPTENVGQSQSRVRSKPGGDPGFPYDSIKAVLVSGSMMQ